MGSISIRKSIRWLPDEAQEPTSTIVLTSPQRRFVDLRILKPPTSGVETAANGNLPFERLDWAIAGTSSSSKRQENGEEITRGRWDHWIDNRTTEAVADEGDMFPISESQTLEKGRMVNPDTGRETDYEEIWDDESPGTIAGYPGTQIRCVVLKLDTEKGEKGLVVLLGRHCQAMLRTKDEVSLERWMHGAAGGWKRLVVMGGEDEFPCAQVLADLGRMEEGLVVYGGGRAWTVVEVA